MIPAGSLNRKVSIVAQTHTPDAFGQPMESWTAVLHNVWASIQTATGKQVYASSGFVSQLSHVITIRYTSTPIFPNMQVRYGTRNFIVQSVSDRDEQHVFIELLCLEIV